jgi:hypothetical protein
MSQIYNIYCDESCHLENDKIPVMVLGAVWCPMNSARTIAERIRELKVKNGLSHYFETKWIKVSQAKLQFYLDLVDYFFDCGDLHFRAVIIPDKSKLKHAKFGQTHDDWYYKMYFTMLKQIFCPSDEYHIYLDIKDTRGSEKVAKLHEVLCNNMYDFSKSIIKRVQLVRSHEIEQLQLADLLIGSVSYVNRDLNTSTAKLKVAERIKGRSRYILKCSTLLREEKFNLFRWHPQEEIL